MKSNLESLKFVRYENSTELQIGIAGVQDTIDFYISNEEIPLVMDCLLGSSKIYPMFSDMSQHMRFTGRGMYYIKLNSYSSFYEDERKMSGKYVEHWIYLNGQWLHEHILSFIQGTGDTWIIDNSDIEMMKFANRSISKFYWYDNKKVDEYHYEFDNYLLRNVAWNLSRNAKGFRKCLMSLKRIANNYSNGNQVIIQVSFDTQADKSKLHPDFYFTIMDGSTRVMSGGIIYHDYNNQYQIHT